MADFDYGPDRWYAPVVLTKNNNDLVVTESGDSDQTVALVTLSAGRYWNHADDSLSGYSGLLDELATQLTSTLSNTYSVSSQTPNGSDLSRSGLQVNNETNADSFTFRFSAAGTTLDPRLLGFGASPGDVSSTNAQINSPYSLRYVWQSSTFIDDKAMDKTAHNVKNIVTSSDDPAEAQRRQYRKRRRRTIEYPYVPGGHVRLNRASDARSADVAGLPQGDINNAWADFWDKATADGASNKLPELIIVHDEGDQDYQIDTHPYEFARLRSQQQVSDVSRTWSFETRNGEMYRLEIDLQVDPDRGSYDQ